MMRRVVAATAMAAWAVCPVDGGASVSDEKNKTLVVYARSMKAVELSDVLTYPARVVPRVNAAVLAESDGVVARIVAPLGRVVRAGQKLMVVQHTDPVYQFAPFVIAAPVGGVVSSVEVTEGSRVSKGDRLATVTDPARPRVLVEVVATDLSSVKAGLVGELRLSGVSPGVSTDTHAPARSTDGVAVRVRGVSPFVDPATGTATCELEPFSSTGKASAGLPLGAMGQVSFRVRAHVGFSVPDHAVVYRGKDSFVRVVDEGGRARRVPVKLGERRRGQVEILEGLREGTLVVERTSGFVADGEVVKVEQDEIPR